MNNEIKKGSLAQVKAASDEGIELTLLRKDFSKESFVRINLNKSAISKCIFHETKFFANEYTDCDFITCDFTKADFLNVKFNNCKFHECKFDEAILQEVNFENCSIMTCSFNNTQLKNDVIGLDENDLKVIHEENAKTIDFESFGFSKNSQQEYTICAQSNDINACLTASLDSEVGQNIWRVMFTVNDEEYLSDTIEVNDNFNKDDALTIMKFILINGKKKALKENTDPEIVDDLNKACDEIKSKLAIKEVSEE